MATAVTARTSRISRLCDGCHWTPSLRGVATIAPGHLYLRHVALPGDEANNTDRPLCTTECVSCACDRDATAGNLLVKACMTFCCGDVPCARPLQHQDGHSCRRCLTARMKALTIRQPYAGAAAAGIKTFENRGRRTYHRGDVLVHAAVARFARADSDPRIQALPGGVDLDTMGAFIAVARLADCHQATDGCCAPWGDPVYGPADKPAWHWVLEGARRLAVPVPFKGSLGLWTPDRDLTAAELTYA